MSAAAAQAKREAAALVAEFGVPKTYDEAVQLVAYAYARGKLSGYTEAAKTALGVAPLEAASNVFALREVRDDT